jgi:predicted DNA-binding transcriptional regulator AlpA
MTDDHRSPQPQVIADRIGATRQTRVLNIRQVSARTGHSPDRIRHLRVQGHELYDKAWKNGAAANAPLQWDETDVDHWVAVRKQESRHVHRKKGN